MRKTSIDPACMNRALALALRGAGRVHPNPLVGAVLVKDGRVIGEGAHQRYGGPHAEVHALREAGRRAKGATLYVTLEPCAHTGKTPPCTDLIIRSQVKKVVAALKDPHPLVSGRGLRALRKAGIRVVTGVMAKEAVDLNRDFFYWAKHKRPYVTVKVAQTLDGKIATAAGQSRWITGPVARRLAHRLRARSDAVLVGVNTVIRDNPRLNVRHVRSGARPLKIILDSRLNTPLASRIFQDRSKSTVLLAVTRRAPKGRVRLFRTKAEVLQVKERRGRVDLGALLKILGKRGIVRVLIEGGADVIGSAFQSRCVNEVYFFVAPTILGGRAAVPSVGGTGAADLKQTVRIRDLTADFIGPDMLIHGRVG